MQASSVLTTNPMQGIASIVSAGVAKQQQSQMMSGSSLESRLSNIMENMNTFPSSLLGTLFSNKIPKIVEEAKAKGSPIIGGTPVNDENAGHETPLQDESTVDRANLNGQLTEIPSNATFSNVVGGDIDWRATEPIGVVTSMVGGFPWGVSNSTSVYDTDERVLSANVEPMDMDLDEEIEDVPASIIDSVEKDKRQSNLITVVCEDSEPKGADNGMLNFTAESATQNSVSNSQESNYVDDENMMEDTQRLIEQQLSSSHVEPMAQNVGPPVSHAGYSPNILSYQTKPSNFNSMTGNAPNNLGSSYSSEKYGNYNTSPVRPQYNVQVGYDNPGNGWRNPLPQQRRPYYRGRHHPVSYPFRGGLPSQRWRY
ncbi:Uncharacterised protein at_DN0685 [Pycnogonum litorale]